MQSRRAGNSWRITAYAITRQVLVAGIDLLESLFAGFWLGILSDKHLDTIEQRYYMLSPFGRAEHNRRGLFYWERCCLDRFPASGRILVIAAGGGREMLALTQRGFDVDGCECNALLAAAANALLANHGCSVALSARDEFVARRPPYDAVIVGWGSYAQMCGVAKRVRFLKSLVPVLKPGAPVLVSFPTRSARARGLRVTQAVANVLRWLTFRPPLEFGDTLRHYSIHHFTRTEIEAEIQRAGYEVDYYGEIEYGHAVCRQLPDGQARSQPIG